MANSKQAKKRVNQSLKRRLCNNSRRSTMRTLLKKTTKAIKEKNITLIDSLFTKLQSILDRYATKGLIHKNKSARHKSRLVSRIKNLKKIKMQH